MAAGSAAGLEASIASPVPWGRRCDFWINAQKWTAVRLTGRDSALRFSC
jgi:hypothetical protein